MIAAMTSASTIARVDDDIVDRYRHHDASCEEGGAGGGEEEEEEEVGGEEEKKEDDGGQRRDVDDVDADVESRGGEDAIRVIPRTNETVLDYDSYLAHQRYHDDLKHVDHNYIDYGDLAGLGGGGGGGGRGGRGRRRLVVEQRKRLGKGGLCWDAAFVLGEHVARDAREWREDGRGGIRGVVVGRDDDRRRTRIVELGAGTGLCGPNDRGLGAELRRGDHGPAGIAGPDAIERRAQLRRSVVVVVVVVVVDGGAEEEEDGEDDARGATLRSREAADAVLRWGVEDDYGDVPYDVVIGADVVTSLYDPVALARTIHALSGPRTRVYVSGKARLDRPHEVFEGEMGRLYANVRKVERPCSRLRSPNVFVIVADGKR
ncbi:hypothetical protein ACHAW5_001456 [Stephanodiscus triporus]|uniref:Calmodulin-lysine N-methyltransferase n=1 Tax=Stephanodiscus triporus TaxID=2934178 RepID=A0ABD3N3S5_9STRA